MQYEYLVRDRYDLLTKSEKKVADYVLKVGGDIMYATMSDVKQNTGVGDATIIRFCQKLDFSGFSDFKIEVAKEDYKNKEFNYQTDFYDEIAAHLADAMTSTAKLINRNNLDKAIALLSDSKNIYIFGVGGSGQVGQSFETILLREGVHAKAISDPHFQAQVASLLKPEDLVIGFSLSGRTKDTYNSLKIAKENGAQILSITNYENSPIGRLGDVVLQTAIEEFLNGGSVAGRISQLFMCEVLTQGYESKNKINALALREKVLRSIIDKSIQ